MLNKTWYKNLISIALSISLLVQVPVAHAVIDAPGAAKPVGGSGGLQAHSAQQRYAPGELLVIMKDDNTLSADRSGAVASPQSGLQSLLQKHQARGFTRLGNTSKWSPKLTARWAGLTAEQQTRIQTLRARFNRMVKIKVVGQNMEAVAAEFRKNPGVEHAQPNYIRRVTLVPNDTYYGTQGAWGQGFDDLWGIKKINSATAWDRTQGLGVVVAVVDTGVDITHPDIAANIWRNTTETAGNGTDDDGNGFADDVNGWSFVDNNNVIADRYGHGSHVAGTIAAVGGNNAGVIGVAPKAKIMVVKVLNDSGSGYSSDIVKGIHYAVDNGADVINASYGGGWEDAAERAAVSYANAAGTVFVAAAGNNNVDAKQFFPASFPEVITVGASTHDGKRASFSNYGERIDVMAPGQDILSILAPNSYLSNGTVVGGKYLVISGTSMAAPHVAGVAALIVSKHPDYTPEQVRWVIRNNAGEFGLTGWDPETGYGIIDSSKVTAFNGVPPKLFSMLTGFTDKINNQPMNYGRGDINFLGGASGADFSQYTLSYASYPLGAGMPSSFTNIGSFNTAVVLNGSLGGWNGVSNADGRYLLRLRVTSTTGLSMDSFSVYGKDSTLKPGFPVLVNGSAPDTYLSTPRSLAFADLNGDGKKEVIAVVDGVVSVLTANGALLWSVTPGNWIYTAPTVADLDGDGKLEVIVATAAAPNGPMLHAYRFDGSPVAGFPSGNLNLSTANAELKIANGSVVAADLDGDGKPELIYVAHMVSYTTGTGIGGYLNVVNSNGTQRSGWPKTVGTTEYDLLRPLVVADVDGDGKPEIIYSSLDEASATQKLTTYAADGTVKKQRSWTNVKSSSPQDWWIHRPTSIDFAADANGDGKVELFTQTLDVNPGGTAFKRYLVDANLANMTGWPKGQLMTDGIVAPVDLLGDGKIKLVAIANTASGAKNLTAYNSDGTLVSGMPKVLTGDFTDLRFPFTGATAFAPVNKAIAGAFFFQLPGDQNFSSNPRSGMYAIDTQGKPLPGWPKLNTGGDGAPVIADLDGDGTLEIGVIDYWGRVNVWSEAAPANPNLSWSTFMGNNQRTGAYPLPPFSCKEYTATNSSHVTAGRAYSTTTGTFIKTTTWYANGSANNLGTAGTTSNKLAETQRGYFIKGSCPAGATAPVINTIGATVSGTTATISGTASDANSNLSSVEVDMDGNGVWLAASGTSSWTTSRANLSVGSHTARARAKDSGGLVSALVSVTFSITGTSVCFAAKNPDHITAGRAVSCGTVYSPKACAKGSGNDLGSNSAYFPATSSVKQTGTDYWVKVTSCP